jgi:adenine-specific DNA-methyltransferase
LEPRILIENEAVSYHASTRRDGDEFDNILVHGDNLLGLRALAPEYLDSVMCAYIDPPYNTGSAFDEYEDGLEHSLWLSLIRERLEVIKTLLHPEGTIWINIDDNEGHYLKVLCDEIFGRRNFVSTVIWQKKYGPKADTRHISSSHDFILVYAKDIERAKIKRLPKGEKQTSRYVNKDGDPRGPWKAGDVLRNEVRDYAVFPVTLPSGREVWPSAGTSWRFTKDKFAELIADNRIWFGVDGDARPALKRFLSEVSDTIPAESIWGYDAVGHNDEAKKESKALFGDRVFSTPKPERLIQRVLEIATDEGDLVLDSFAGSGTTGAVAHKMSRKWIMIELGDHCETHVVPRLKKVIDGTDPGGVTKAVEWKGGGGYRYFRLAPSLLEKDQFGQWVISKAYNPEMLAAAMCKHFSFTYAPSTDHYWMHGQASETDFIYVTTNSLTHEQLRAISEEVGDGRTLLICCKAFQGTNADSFANLTIRKIPGAILDRCEWGKDDYSLKIEALPLIEDEPEDEPSPARAKASGRVNADNQPALFDAEGEA